jgi:Homeodomain-like domain
MGRAGRPTVAIELTDEERETLVRWSRRHSSSQALALRSRIVLACAGGRPNTKIADELGCDRVTVGKWRHRFAAERLEGLVDAPRPGAARTISDEVVEAVVVEALETTPKHATHWSTRSMAQRHGISRQTVVDNPRRAKRQASVRSLVVVVPQILVKDLLEVARPVPQRPRGHRKAVSSAQRRSICREDRSPTQ